MSTDLSAHLDAETIAAWMDGGLDDASLAAAEAHASTCERCQAILASVAKTTPVVVAEKRPFRIPAWWYPLAAGAAAVVIWMVVPAQRQIATEPSRPAAVQGATPPAASSDAAERARDAISDQPKEIAAAKKENVAPRRSIEDSTLKPQTQNKVETQGFAAPQAATAAAAPAPAPPPAPAAPMMQKSARLEAARSDAVSPDGTKRWQFSDYGPDVTGGAAISQTTCWLVGRGGLVMLTTNGTTFDHVDLPERVDVTSITAADARSATVTTADGRRFQTDDGGRNWRQIQA